MIFLAFQTLFCFSQTQNLESIEKLKNDSIAFSDKTGFRKNQIYFESDMMIFSFNYERIKPLKKNNILAYSIGAGYFWEEPIISGKLTYSMGGSRHFFETGIVTYYYTKGLLGGVIIGYRYHGSKGWILRGPIMITNNPDEGPVWFWMGFSIGYSF